MRWVSPVLALVLALGCGPSGDDAGGGDGGGNGADGGTPAVDGAPGQPDAEPPLPQLPACHKSCSAPQDCVIPNQPLYDERNWACDTGICRWQGCLSSAECSSFGAGYVCRPIGGGLSSCLKSCAAASDCATTGATYDADNWRCDDSVCRWQGCNTSSECVADLGAGYVCGGPSPSLPTCVKSCTAPASCTSGGQTLDGDNWTCEAGECRWQGCNDDGECMADFGAEYVCR